MANGNPSTAPYRRISPGHSSPISNDSTVPVTAPTATSTPIACDQRRASRNAVSSRRRNPMNSASNTTDGSATPRHARLIWNPSGVAICARAAPLSDWGASSEDPGPGKRLGRASSALPASCRGAAGGSGSVAGGHEPVDEVEGGLGDLAPAVVDGEGVAPVGDLHDLGYGG